MGVTRQSPTAGALHPRTRHRRFGAIGLLLFAGLVAAKAYPAPADGTTVRDLYYGEVLFNYYQQDYFTAITHLLAAQQQERIERNRTDTELLRVGIELSYGMHANALEVFKRTLGGNVDQAARDRIWLSLAKVWQRRGYLDRAEDALAQIGDGLSREARAERVLLQARILMARSRYNEAALALGAVAAPPDWAAFLHFNQAVALQRSGQQAAGMSLLNELGQLKIADEELLSLRDKANLTLGFGYLDGRKPDAAKTVLERIRLNGPFSNQALLGLGWAEYGLGDASKALNSWSELQGRGAADAAILEARVMVPYAQWRLHAYREAVQKYRDVISAYDDEFARLDATIAKAKTGALLAELARSDNRLDQDAFPARIADEYAAPFLLPLLASDHFREPFVTYRNLRHLEHQLDTWLADMSAFNDMLATRRVAYESRLPRVQERLQGLDWRALDAQVGKYTRSVDGIVAREDVMALATAREQRLLDQIAQIAGRLARHPQAHQLDPLRLRTRILKGLVHWEIEQGYPARLWEARKGVTVLNQTLTAAKDERTRLAQAQDEAPGSFAGYDGRISALRARISGLQIRLAAAVQRHEGYLNGLIAGDLEHQRQVLQGYRLDARYALARLLDEMATGTEVR